MIIRYDPRLGPKARQRMGRARRISQGRTRLDAAGGQTIDDVVHQSRLAADQVRRTGDLDPKAIATIDGHQGRVAAERPQREPLERCGVGRRIGFDEVKTRHTRLGLSDRKTRDDAQR